MDKSVTLTDFNAPREPGALGECVPPAMEITWPDAGIGIAVVVAAAVLVAALWQMRRRDVT